MLKLKGVTFVAVDLDRKLTTIEFMSNGPTVTDLEAAIAGAGYTANSRLADSTAYRLLPDCCKK